MAKPADALLQKLSSGKKQSKKGLPKRTGKRAAKYKAYYASRYLTNKLRRILRRNGLAAARTWATAHMADGILSRLVR